MASFARQESGFNPAAIPNDIPGRDSLSGYQPGQYVPQGASSVGYGQQASSMGLSSMTPGGPNMYNPSMTPGSAMSGVYMTPDNKMYNPNMTPGSSMYAATTPGSQLSPQFYDPNLGPSPNQMSPVPVYPAQAQSPPPMHQQVGGQPPVQYNIHGSPTVCVPSGPVRPGAGTGLDPALEMRLMGLGDLPSIGSAGHMNGTCKRCAFHEKGRCQNGAACNFCHFPHEKRVRKNKRGKKNANKFGVKTTPTKTL